ncbi:GIY-YIG nuclease family protein [Citrobacter portucalensis]|uniref:GIY-YIG nuclease family protein n=1 Tax=Citrobacter portucalensis TaxID=1639133 RepID=UPI001BD11F34|nr:GIY-YIG nuclease family protein [Citrobacter portucalensis]
MMRLTTAEINRRLAPREIKLVGDYAGYYQKSRFLCPLGHEWEARANNILNGGSCRVCYEAGRRDRALKWTREKVVAMLAKKGISFISGDFKDTQVIADYFCNVCNHKWSAYLHGVLHKTSCPACSYAKKRAKGEQQLMKRLAGLGLYFKGEYKGQQEPVTIFCSHGHEWESIPKLSNRWLVGCPYCDGRAQHTNASITTKLKPLGFELVGHYKTNRHKTRFRCVNGHEFDTAPSRLLRGGGCPHCNNLVRLDAAGANARLAPKNIVLRGDYNGTRHKSDFLCLNCGHEWAANANSLLNSNAACPKCVGYSVYHAEECYIYVMTVGHMTKIGISINPKRRCQQIKMRTKEPVELLAVYEYGIGNGREALIAEKMAHDFFSPFCSGLKGFDGASELFHITAAEACDYLLSVGCKPVMSPDFSIELI